MSRQVSIILGFVFAVATVAAAQKDERAGSRASALKQKAVVEVAVWGAAELATSEITPSIQTKRGDVPTEATLEADRNRIVALYKARGFLHATVTVTQIPAREGEGIVAVFHVVEGPRERPETRKPIRGR